MAEEGGGEAILAGTAPRIANETVDAINPTLAARIEALEYSDRLAP
jgi:hypothetical protein